MGPARDRSYITVRYTKVTRHYMKGLFVFHIFHRFSARRGAARRDAARSGGEIRNYSEKGDARM